MWSARQSRKMGRRVAGLLGGLLVGLLLVAAPAAAALSNVSNSALVPSGSPAIAVNKAGRVFVAWKEGSGSNFRILFRRSKPTQGICGGGLEFDEMPVSLWAGSVAPSRPALAANDTEVFVAWQASSAVWFNRSTNDGQAFFDPVPPSPVNLGSSRSELNVPSVATDTAGRIFVAWSNGSFPAEIFLTRYPSSGGGFEPAQPVSGTPLDSRAPSLATDGTNIFLAWEESGPGPLGFLNSSILHKKFRIDVPSLTEVASLGATNLSTGLGRAFGPSVAFGDGFLSVVFGASNGPSFYHSLGTSNVSSSDGMSFSLPVDVSGVMTTLSPSDARVARRNGSALVAWAQRLGQTEAADIEIRDRLLLGNGAMGSSETVSPTPGQAASPAAAMDSTGRRLVAWQGRETADLLNDEVYVSYNGGTDGEPMTASVEMTPQTLNAKTMYQGEGIFTLRIRVPGVGPGAIDVNNLNLKINGQPVIGSLVPVSSSVGDADGDGTAELELKFHRRDLKDVFGGATLTTAQRDGNYTVTGNTRDGCFSGGDSVRIIH